MRHKGLAVWGFACAAVLAALPAILGSQSASVESKVDAVFAKWNSGTPGCAVGVSTGGVPVLAKGYGMADLEHDVRISPESILEAGSVSKQFTAAAVMLLARDGKLSLDDQARTYIPELPDYLIPPGTTAPVSAETASKPQAAKAGGLSLTIRHMLNHTSGLRD
jgi:CubicO group peptidase (beta-lactamase class C family)